MFDRHHRALHICEITGEHKKVKIQNLFVKISIYTHSRYFEVYHCQRKILINFAIEIKISTLLLDITLHEATMLDPLNCNCAIAALRNSFTNRKFVFENFNESQVVQNTTKNIYHHVNVKFDSKMPNKK